MFIVNDIYWSVIFVESGSYHLQRSDGSVTIGMTDGISHTVYLDKHLKGYMLDKVLAHELCHVFCFSYDVYMNIEEEEFMADWISRYGRELVYLLDNLMKKIASEKARA